MSSLTESLRLLKLHPFPIDHYSTFRLLASASVPYLVGALAVAAVALVARHEHSPVIKRLCQYETYMLVQVKLTIIWQYGNQPNRSGEDCKNHDGPDCGVHPKSELTVKG